LINECDKKEREKGKKLQNLCGWVWVKYKSISLRLGLMSERVGVSDNAADLAMRHCWLSSDVSGRMFRHVRSNKSVAYVSGVPKIVPISKWGLVGTSDEWSYLVLTSCRGFRHVSRKECMTGADIPPRFRKDLNRGIILFTSWPWIIMFVTKKPCTLCVVRKIDCNIVVNGQACEFCVRQKKKCSRKGM